VEGLDSASLLFQLLENMRQSGDLDRFDFASSAPGQVVEIKATLTKNPILESLEGLLQLLEMGQAFEPPVKKGAPNKSVGLSQVKKQISSLVEGIKTGNTIDLGYVLRSKPKPRNFGSGNTNTANRNLCLGCSAN